MCYYQLFFVSRTGKHYMMFDGFLQVAAICKLFSSQSNSQSIFSGLQRLTIKTCLMTENNSTTLGYCV